MCEILESTQDGVRIIQLNPGNHHNFFSPALEESVKTALKNADEDNAVQALIVYGGPDRSFSGGNDFSEFKNLFGYKGVDEWIERSIDLYASVLKLRKPSIAAIGGGATGLGFQFAMVFDWRIMSNEAKLYMQNLQYGIGCSTGATILEHIVTWNTMREIIYRGDGISAAKALHYGLINDAVGNSDLLSHAISVAKSLAAYPGAAFRNTKRVVNHGLLLQLIEACMVSKQVHRETFSEQGIPPPFQKMLRDQGPDISSFFTPI